MNRRLYWTDIFVPLKKKKFAERSFVQQEQIKTPNLHVQKSNVTNCSTNFQKCPKNINSNKIVLSELKPKKTIYFHFAITASVSQKILFHYVVCNEAKPTIMSIISKNSSLVRDRCYEVSEIIYISVMWELLKSFSDL